MTTVAPGRSEFARSLSQRQNGFPARPVLDDIEDERQFRKQRLAAAPLQLIPHEIAQHTRQQYQQHRDPGWVTFAPHFEEIVHEQPDLLD
ncbi:hypothetical protein [Saccharopolyspora spinosa]|uniref:hypothetical protein n=1 Tax=Saccharopolyspora spinosa TaxID=60894 RepID=UPI00023789AD|nr:hypothetical protein [Saccharopolyspora spinosa]